MKKNLDKSTVDSFGDEWGRFNQMNLPDEEAEAIFNQYFSIFPWDSLPENPEGFDLGCGSGRWAKLQHHKLDIFTVLILQKRLRLQRFPFQVSQIFHFTKNL